MFHNDQNSNNKIKTKILNKEGSLKGFLLQKDLNTTSLLFNNKQFPIKDINEYLQFRPISGKKPDNPNSSLKILRQNGNISENTENEKIFYLLSTFKPKKLKHKKLKLPIPYKKTEPLYKTFYTHSFSNNKIRCMEDDLNITSKCGKKVVYKMKEKINVPKLKESNYYFSNKNILNVSRNKTFNCKTLNNKQNYLIKFNKIAKTKNQNDRKDMLTIKKAILQINNNLKLFEEEEKERKKLFYKNSFFTTELLSNKIQNSKRIHRNLKSLFVSKGNHRNVKSLFD